MRAEYLFYFPDTPAYDGPRYLGIMPAHYMTATGWDREAAIAAGGVDVSDNPASWRAYERQIATEYGV